MIDWNDCLPTKEMQADFERFKELKTTEEKEAFKKEMQDKYNKLRFIKTVINRYKS